VKKTLIIAGLTTALGFGGGMAAQASSATNTGTHTSTLVSAKCYDYKSTTISTFSWSSKAQSYVVHSPRRTVSTYRHCHP
jgi:hypothetical protein